MIAVGQDIVSAPFEEFGIPAKWNILQAGLDTEVKEIPGVFTGGDCATGPSTVIRAIAAGKVAAHNIDEYLGYHHTLTCEAVVPEPKEICVILWDVQRLVSARQISARKISNM